MASMSELITGLRAKREELVKQLDKVDRALKDLSDQDEEIVKMEKRKAALKDYTPQETRDKISVSMKKVWDERRKKLG